MYASLSGSDFDGTDAGFGLDGQVRFPLASSFTLGLGGQFTSHGLQGLSDNLKVLGIFAEPRLMFATPGSLKPYLAARGGYLHESVSSGGSSASASGWYAGGGGGLLIAVGPMVSVDLGALFSTASFGDFSVNGTSVANTSTSGTVLSVRGGILVQLGK
ncbi:MAG TPA: hypothetical protein VNH46_02275 [Gemmatimonadales bacterium]|nr:hypothetical protein [Gemmatimonadales bacterium]